MTGTNYLGVHGYAIRAVKTRPPPHKTGFIQKIATIFQGLFKDLIRFSGKPTRNVIDRFVHKCTFPLHGNRRFELFAPPVSLHFSVYNFPGLRFIFPSGQTKSIKKTLSRPLLSKLKKIQGLFKESPQNSRTCQNCGYIVKGKLK